MLLFKTNELRSITTRRGTVLQALDNGEDMVGIDGIIVNKKYIRQHPKLHNQGLGWMVAPGRTTKEFLGFGMPPSFICCLPRNVGKKRYK
jgi:hypothetical protein